MKSTAAIIQLIHKYPPEGKARRAWEPKRGGGLRPIAKPNKVLGAWLKAMNSELNTLFDDWPPYMHGGISKRSYVTYALPHVGKKCVISVDVQNCFGSISAEQVVSSIEQYLILDRQTAGILAKQLCFRGEVAQGFSTSNFICNLFLLHPLAVLEAGFREQGLDFTNYVDDLALSGDSLDCPEAINRIAVELSRAGLAMKKSKVHVMPSSKRQILCGLQVNTRLTITRAKKLELLSAVATGSISRKSADGWVANLKSFDSAFAKKFSAFADKSARLR